MSGGTPHKELLRLRKWSEQPSPQGGFELSIDSIIRGQLYGHSVEWSWDGPRFLIGPGIRLVLASDDRWTFVVGDQRGYVKLSRFTHACIEMARALKSIPDKTTAQRIAASPRMERAA
jgi:hypothetical protein